MLVNFLARISRLKTGQIRAIERNASRRYKTYEIPKRSGGTRTIHHPSRELKALQRLLTKLVFDKLPVHSCASAYEKDSGIKQNATAHASFDYTTRVDFENFFPSFSNQSVRLFLSGAVTSGQLTLEPNDIAFIANIVSRYGYLTIGAPSSPKLTNRMMYAFDSTFNSYCNERGLIYTRYADDIFVSSSEPKKMNGLSQVIQGMCNDVAHLNITINAQKTLYLSRKNKRQITGLIITTERNVSMGRSRKREIKSLVHKALEGNLPIEELSRLTGLLSFASDVEPNFLVSLSKKYGEQEVKRLSNRHT